MSNGEANDSTARMPDGAVINQLQFMPFLYRFLLTPMSALELVTFDAPEQLSSVKKSTVPWMDTAAGPPVVSVITFAVDTY